MIERLKKKSPLNITINNVLFCIAHGSVTFEVSRLRRQLAM